MIQTKQMDMHKSAMSVEEREREKKNKSNFEMSDLWRVDEGLMQSNHAFLSIFNGEKSSF